MSLGFLAGLFMLGTAGVMHVNEREKQRQAYQDYLVRREEEKKYLNDKQHLAMKIKIEEYIFDGAGFNIRKMREQIENDGYSASLSSYISAIAIGKYYSNIYGYQYSSRNYTGYRHIANELLELEEPIDFSKYTTQEFREDDIDEFLIIPEDGGPIKPISYEEAKAKGIIGNLEVQKYLRKVGIFSLFHMWYKNGTIERREVKYEQTEKKND